VRQVSFTLLINEKIHNISFVTPSCQQTNSVREEPLVHVFGLSVCLTSQWRQAITCEVTPESLLRWNLGWTHAWCGYSLFFFKNPHVSSGVISCNKGIAPSFSHALCLLKFQNAKHWAFFQCCITFMADGLGGPAFWLSPGPLCPQIFFSLFNRRCG